MPRGIKPEFIRKVREGHASAIIPELNRKVLNCMMCIETHNFVSCVFVNFVQNVLLLDGDSAQI